MSPSALLLDLEGTATSIAFVKDILFPYANENVEKFLTASWDKEDVQDAVEGMRQQATIDVKNKVDGAIPIPEKDCSKEDQIDGVSKNLRWLNDIGNKGTHMKKLSGYIWQYGYENGDIKGHIYDDVYPAIQTWKSNGKKVYIYSSGSVLAQKLLVKYSVSGDLESVIDDYFDTEVGNKREVSSYNNILEKIKFPGVDVLFLTDIVEEANAATEAGMNAMLLAREGNAPLTDEAKEKYTVIGSFAEVDGACTLKRKASDEEDLPPTKIAKTATSDDVVVENDKEISNDIPAAIVKEDAMEVDASDITESPKIEPEAQPVIADEIQTESTPSVVDAKIETEKIPDTDMVEVILEISKVPSAAKEKVEVEKSDDSDKTEEPSIEISDRGQIPSEMETEECNIPANTVVVDNPSKDIEETVIEKTEPVIEAVAANEKNDESIDSKPTTEDVTENGTSETIEVISKEILTEEIATLVVPAVVEEDRLKIEENVDVSKSIPESDVPTNEDDEKLNDLLGEKGIALEKECEEILSKVEQVTNANKILTAEPTEKMDILDEIQATENGTSDLLPDVETNGEKISVDDLVSTVPDDVLDVILPELPIEESDVKPTDDSDAKPTEELPQTIVDEIITKEADEATDVTIAAADVIKEDIPANDKTELDTPADDAVEVNGGGEKIEIPNGNGTHDLNGKSDDRIQEVNGKTADVIDAEQKSTNTNGTAVDVADAKEEQTEIKVKKIAVEEPAITEQTEQVIEA